jgi:8-oxo-dGTP pyrophosphatase MutT (NUDIX family)
MTAVLIKTLLNHIPRHAEEEGDFYSIPRAELITALCAENSVDRAIAENSISLIETLLDTLAVLNPHYLAQGEWSFISFPAQLLAMSVLTAMSDKDSHFFVTNFWNTQGISNDKKDQQRDILKNIEHRRVENSKNAEPIRFIYVAWSIIKLDDKILFYQREDTQKRYDKNAGDYGLVGGRLNQTDVHNCSGDIKTCLQNLQSKNSPLIKAALPETLKRELQEEAGLEFEKHYQFKLWRELKPYQQIQGSAPNHAFTEYYLEIFQIELTLEGYLFLQQKIKTDERLVLFSLEEVAAGQTADGKVAYIKALVNDFANNRDKLKTALQALPNSFNSSYLFTREKYGLTLLQNTDKPLCAGVLGKEKVLDVVLTERQNQLLFGLAAHNRGFEFTELSAKIILHPFGWVELENNSDLQQEFIELSKLLRQTEFTIENQQDRFFRLSVAPSMLYFDENLFSYSVKQADLNSTKSKVTITLARCQILTALGIVTGKSEDFSISLNLADGLNKLSQTEYSADNDRAKQIEDLYKKSLHQEYRFSTLALKALLRREAGMIKFCVNYQLL